MHAPKATNNISIIYCSKIEIAFIQISYAHEKFIRFNSIKLIIELNFSCLNMLVASFLKARFILSFTAPIHIAYMSKHKHTFKDGYFISIEPGYYKLNSFGIRLKCVLEVIDTNEKHYSGGKFLAFRVATLVPFETKLIDVTLLNVQEVR